MYFTDRKTIWQTGFFDTGSFNEIMAAWAQTVIVGRARYCHYMSVITFSLCKCDSRKGSCLKNTLFF